MGFTEVGRFSFNMSHTIFWALGLDQHSRFTGSLTVDTFQPFFASAECSFCHPGPFPLQLADKIIPPFRNLFCFFFYMKMGQLIQKVFIEEGLEEGFCRNYKSWCLFLWSHTYIIFDSVRSFFVFVHQDNSKQNWQKILGFVTDRKVSKQIKLRTFSWDGEHSCMLDYKSKHWVSDQHFRRGEGGRWVSIDSNTALICNILIQEPWYFFHLVVVGKSFTDLWDEILSLIWD